MREYLLTTFVAAAVTYLVAGPVRAVAVRFGVLAEVRDRDVHDVPIPRLGGVAMVVGLAAALLVASKMPLLRSVFATGDEPKGVLLAAVVICLIGVVDDVWGLDAITKLAGQSLAAGLMALQGVQLLWLPGPGQTIALGPAEGTLITVLVVVVTVNAVNFVDGLDGLAAGIVGISASAFFLFSYLLSVQNAIERALTRLSHLGGARRGLRGVPACTTSTRPASSWATPARWSSVCCSPRRRSRSPAGSTRRPTRA